MRKSTIQKALWFSSAFFLMISYQNCANNAMPVVFSEASVRDIFGDIDCVTLGGSDKDPSCLKVKNGLVGNIYYLLDKDPIGSSSPTYLYDKNDQPIRFNGTDLNSVNVILDRGYKSPSYIVLPNVAVPVLEFTDGFKNGSNAALTDVSGKVLIEGFALDLKGSLKLGPSMAEGVYQIAILSDDGAILDMDVNQDGRSETVINSDGYHSAKLACGNQALVLSKSSRIPMRLRYYQGPRTKIALTVMMRKVDSIASGLDSECGVADGNNGRWFSSVDPSSGLILADHLRDRGWFVPDALMYVLPNSL